MTTLRHAIAFLACCALSAAPASSPTAACGCAVGAPDRTVFEYGCCDGGTTLSETVTAPLTCGGAGSGRASGTFTATREECGEYPPSASVTLSGTCEHGSRVESAVTVALVPRWPDDGACGDGEVGETSEAGRTGSAAPNAFSARRAASARSAANAVSANPSRHVPKGAPTWRLSLGRSAAGGFAGRLDLLPSAIFDPGLTVLDSSVLTLTGGAETGLDVVNAVVADNAGRRFADPRRFVGIRAAECYAAFSSPTSFPFSVSLYHASDIADGLDEDGNYFPRDGAAPFAVHEIGFGDTDAHAMAYRVTTRRPGAPDETLDLYCDEADGATAYGVSRGGGEWVREVSSSSASGGVRRVVERVGGRGGWLRTTAYEYASVAGREVLLSRTASGGGETRRDAYSYDALGRRTSHLSPAGLLTEWEHDGDGRPSLVRETAPGLPVRETSLSYAPLGVRPHRPGGSAGVADDDGSVDRATPRVEAVSVGGVPVSKTLRFAALDSAGHRVVEEVRLADPAATDHSAEWENAANVRTYTDCMPEDGCRACSRRPSLVVNADGTVDAYSYGSGDYAPGAGGAAGVFEPRPGGPFFRTVATRYPAGSAATNGGTVAFSPLPGRTTREVTVEVRSSRRVVLRELHVCTGTGPDGFVRVSWTATWRDALGQETLSVSSDGTRTEKSYAGRRLASETDALGLATAYSRDALGRAVSATRSGGGVRPDATTATSYDPEGRVLSRTTAAGGLSTAEAFEYDAFGRMSRSVAADGVETRFLHASDAAAGTETRTEVRAFGTDCAVTNETVSFADGRARETRLNGMAKTAFAYGPFETTEFAGPARAASPRRTRTVADALGRVVAEERAGFRGAALAVSNEWGSAGRLVASRRYADGSLLGATLFRHDRCGRRTLSVEDLDLDGEVGWSGPDAVFSNDVRHVLLDGYWWRETSLWQARTDGSPELTRVSATLERLTGLGAADATGGVLVSETREIDSRGNATVSQVRVDREAHEETRTTQEPGSALAAVEVRRAGLLASATSATGVATAYEHDALGREVARVDGRAGRTETAYDARGRVARTVDALGGATAYGYDALGRRTSATDPLTNAVETAYDAEGRVVSVRGAAHPVDFAYDAFGGLVSATTWRDAAHGDTTRWLRDEATGLVTNKVYSDGLGPSYGYAPDGRLARRTWARGVSAEYSYDAAGRLTETAYSDGTPTVAISCDRTGNMVSATTDGVAINICAYDVHGNCTNEWQDGFTVERSYDALGRPAGYAAGGTRTTLAYDGLGRLASMEILSHGRFTWAYYESSGLKASLSCPNGLSASWDYDACGRIARVENATESSVVSRFDCAYDAAGRLASVARSGAAFGALSGAVDRYSCNARGETTGARRTKGGLPVRGFSEDFAYDLAGNRTSSAACDETGAARTSTYAANALNQYASRTTPGFAAMRGEADSDAAVTVNGRPAFRLGAYFFGGDDFDNSESGGFAELVAYAAKAQTDGEGGDAEDLVSCVTGRVYVAQSEEAFEYDADGNQTLVTTATGRWRVEYDGENRPVRWTREGDGKTVAMSYDHLGRRRTKDDQRFFYDGYLQVANERAVSNEVVRESFVWDPTEPVATRPLAWVGAGGEMRVYAHDWNKNVSEVVAADADTNAAVEMLAHYDYAAFGAVVAQKGDCAEANPWRFSSEYADADLGLVYYNYRHYDPLSGRWLARDPIEEDGGQNLYGFCGNSPSWMFDAVGLKVLILKHWKGIAPPGGWGDGGRNRGQTHYEEPTISYKPVKKDRGKIGFEISITPPVSVVNIYFHESADLLMVTFAENQHVQWILRYDEAIETFKREAEAIEECPQQAYRSLSAAIERLNRKKEWIVAENDKLDAPGGPHGH